MKKIFAGFGLSSILLSYLLQALAALGTLTAGGIGYVVALENAVECGDLLLHPPKFPWSHNGMFSAFDHDR